MNVWTRIVHVVRRVCMYVCMYVSIYARMYVCECADENSACSASGIHAFSRAHMLKHTHRHTDTYMHTYIHAHIYIHTYIHTYIQVRLGTLHKLSSTHGKLPPRIAAHTRTEDTDGHYTSEPLVLKPSKVSKLVPTDFIHGTAT